MQSRSAVVCVTSDVVEFPAVKLVAIAEGISIRVLGRMSCQPAWSLTGDARNAPGIIGRE